MKESAISLVGMRHAFGERAVFGTTNPITIDGKTEEKSLTQKFAERADLSEDVYVSDEGFGCGGTAIGVESMCKWLQEQPIGTYAVYVTQDWPTKMVQDRNVEALFSDAVVPALVAEKLGINLQEHIYQ